MTARDGLVDLIDTQYDVARDLWDMYHEQNVSMLTPSDVDDDANPENWKANYVSSPLTNNPMTRLQSAASSNGVSAAHANQEDNGVDHY